MRWILVVVTSLMIALGACTQSSTPMSVGLAPPSRSSGVLGDITYVGGPGPASPAALRLRPGSVTAFTPGGVQRAVAVFAEGHGFSIPLAPGTYRLVSKSGDARCPARTVTVLPGGYETVRIRCSVK